MIAFIVVLVTILGNSVNGANILGIFMTPSYSHQIVFQPIWKELSLRGHQVTIATPNPLMNSSLTNLTEIDLSSTYDLIRMSKFNRTVYLKQKPTALSEEKRLAKIYESLTHYQLRHPEMKKLIRNRNVTFDLLLVEYIYPAMFVFKDIFNCPMIGISSLALTPFGHELIGNPNNPIVNPHFALPYSSDLTFIQRLMSVFFDIRARFSYRYSLMNRLDSILPEYIGTEIRPLYDICQEFSLVIMNSNLALQNARPLVPNLIEISGIHKNDPKPLPQDLKRFLDNSTEGVIYFSLGSNTKSSMLPQEKLNKIIKALSSVPFKILWKFEDKNLPNKPENIKIREWLPQQDLLAHPNIKLFITQGGLQSLDEAVYRKVPTLIIPLLADQKHNAHLMFMKGVSVTIDFDSFSTEDLKAAILDIINNPKYRENINKLYSIATDHPMPALQKAVWWIEYVLRHKGAEHLKFAGRDIPFYRFYMLDIIAVFTLCFLIFIYLIISIIRYCKHQFLNFKNVLMKKKNN